MHELLEEFVDFGAGVARTPRGVGKHQSARRAINCRSDVIDVLKSQLSAKWRCCCGHRSGFTRVGTPLRGSAGAKASNNGAYAGVPIGAQLEDADRQCLAQCNCRSFLLHFASHRADRAATFRAPQLPRAAEHVVTTKDRLIASAPVTALSIVALRRRFVERRR